MSGLALLQHWPAEPVPGLALLLHWPAEPVSGLALLLHLPPGRARQQRLAQVAHRCQPPVSAPVRLGVRAVPAAVYHRQAEAVC